MHYLCIRKREIKSSLKSWSTAYILKNCCGNSSVGRARPCQGRGREFESRLPLMFYRIYNTFVRHAEPAQVAEW